MKGERKLPYAASQGLSTPEQSKPRPARPIACMAWAGAPEDNIVTRRRGAEL